MRTVDLFRYLLYCAAGFSAALLVSILVPLCGEGVPLSWLYQGVQWGQTIFLMILPPILWTRFQQHRPVWSYLRLNRVSWPSLLYVVAIMLTATPLLEWLAEVNEAMPLPAAIEEVSRASQAASKVVMTIMMDNGNGPVAWASLILLVSVATAIGEELMFRGGVLNLMLTSRWNRHAVAWTVGFIFSAIHFDPYGFLPRWLLGTFFVYLVYATDSLWPAIVAHAYNNLIALIEFKVYGLDTNSNLTSPWFVAGSVVVTALLIYRFFQKSTYWRATDTKS